MLYTDYIKTTEHEHNTWVDGDKWRNHAGTELKGLLRLPSSKHRKDHVIIDLLFLETIEMFFSPCDGLAVSSARKSRQRCWWWWWWWWWCWWGAGWRAGRTTHARLSKARQTRRCRGFGKTTASLLAPSIVFSSINERVTIRFMRPSFLGGGVRRHCFCLT